MNNNNSARNYNNINSNAKLVKRFLTFRKNKIASIGGEISGRSNINYNNINNNDGSITDSTISNDIDSTLQDYYDKSKTGQCPDSYLNTEFKNKIINDIKNAFKQSKDGNMNNSNKNYNNTNNNAKLVKTFLTYGKNKMENIIGKIFVEGLDLDSPPFKFKYYGLNRYPDENTVSNIRNNEICGMLLKVWNGSPWESETNVMNCTKELEQRLNEYLTYGACNIRQLPNHLFGLNQPPVCFDPDNPNYLKNMTYVPEDEYLNKYLIPTINTLSKKFNNGTPAKIFNPDGAVSSQALKFWIRFLWTVTFRHIMFPKYSKSNPFSLFACQMEWEFKLVKRFENAFLNNRRKFIEGALEILKNTNPVLWTNINGILTSDNIPEDENTRQILMDVVGPLVVTYYEEKRKYDN